VEGRPLHGEGLEHERDYIEERIEDAGDVDEYTEAAQTLKQEQRDLQALAGQGGAAGGNAGSTATEDAGAGDQGGTSTDAERMRLRQGTQLEATSGSQIDLDQQPPEAEARAQHVDRLREGLSS
jgi:hypothetical protein